MNTFYSSVFALTVISGAPSLCVAQDSAPPPSAAVTAKAYSTTGSLDGVTFTVNGLKRNANGTLTVSIKLQGTQGKPVRHDAIGFSNGSPWDQEYKLLDLVNKKRYSMLEDSNGHCLCTHITDEELSGLSSGKTKDINIKFPMPPADLASITVELPHSEPIEDVPITN